MKNRSVGLSGSGANVNNVYEIEVGLESVGLIMDTDTMKAF